ncbi:MAG: hypothetical protein V1861_02715 [Candidatus Micrarchaeota archaeon]
MKRLVKDTLEERKPQPLRFSYVKKALAVAAPLIAGLIAGCSGDAGDQFNECRTYNESTVTLNRETNGQSVDLRSLENIPPGSFLTDYHIDFINEAHAIATEGIPPDTKATQSPSYCLVSGQDGRQKSAYAQQDNADGRERGLYVPENPEIDSVTLLNLVSHEIGHLQPGNPENGSEVMSQLNEYEQKLAGFALLIRQGVDSGQLTRWASHESRTGIFSKLARTLESGRGQSGNDPLDAYDKANIFLFTRLGESGGDIAAIRAEFRERVTNSTLVEALDAASEAFLGKFTALNAADLFIDIRTRFVAAMQRHYGMAGSYLEAHSQILDSGLVFGLEGMNCAFTAPLASASYTPCSDDVCVETGADSSREVSVSLCCVSADVHVSEIGFSKWDVEASGTKYKKVGGKVSVYEFEWDSVMYLSIVKTAMGPDDPCT